MTILKPNFYKQVATPYANHWRNGCSVAGYACGEFSVFNIVSATTNHWTNPLQVWNWAWNHGFILRGAGTYWSGIGAMLNAAGIKSWKTTTNWSDVHDALRKNYWCIGIMHRGIWTSGGHFIVAYYVDKNDNIYISDSASYAGYRQFNRFSNFKSQCNNVWIVINPRDYHASGKSTGNHSAMMYTDNDQSNVRKSASGNSKLLGTLKENQRLELDNYSAGWWKITKGTYKGGWIHESNLSKYKHNPHNWIVAADCMNVRDGYSTKNTHVLTTVKKGTKLKSKKSRGAWGYFPKQSGLSKSGWIKCYNPGGAAFLKRTD